MMILLVLCAISTILALCLTLYGMTYNERKPMTIGGFMAFVTLLLLFVIALMW